MAQQLGQHGGEIGSAERWTSMLSGIGLLLTALRRGGPVARIAAGTAGLALVTRGGSGYCALKSALSGESSLSQGIKEQWRRLASIPIATAPREIGNMDELYIAELQELHSAEAQLCGLLAGLPETVSSLPLARQLGGYAAEVRSRREDLERILTAYGVDPREHPDQAMRALLRETRKMARVCAANVREAALLSSLQRVIHFKIAGYGTVTAYAKLLGRAEEASRLADYADREKQIDGALTQFAANLINPRAEQSSASPLSQARAH